MGFLEEAKKMQEEAKGNRLEDKTNTELLNQLEQGNNIREKKIKHEEFIKELYRRAIENIKIGEMERTKITKHNFEDKDEVIDILLYTVGKLSQDPIFYKINVCKLKDHKPIYNNK